MSKTVIMPIPVRGALRKLGEDLSAARRRRRITKALMAERAGIAVNTLTRIEQGSGGVSMAAWAQALFVLGFTEKLRNLADLSTDKTGLLLEDESLPKRVRYPKRREG